MGKFQHPPLFEKNGNALMTGVSMNNVARYVILVVRDPLGYKLDAAEEVASYLDNPKMVADTKMFITYTGTYKNTPVSICSTGSGAPDTELAISDFIRFTKADTFIRLGTSGTYRGDVNVGDLVIAEGAVRDEGTTKSYVKTIYPAVSDYWVTTALLTAAQELGYKYHLGITLSTDSIYCGQGRPLEGYYQEEHKSIPLYWKNAGVLNFERETSAILTLSRLLKRRGGALNVVVNNMETGILDPGAGAKESILTTLEGVHILEKFDREHHLLKGSSGLRNER